MRFLLATLVILTATITLSAADKPNMILCMADDNSQ